MPDVAQEFPHLNDCTQEQLLSRRSQLIGSAPDGNYGALSDLALQELVVIARVLRRRTAAPKSASAKKVVPSVEML